jgi:hypothetical protein
MAICLCFRLSLELNRNDQITECFIVYIETHILYDAVFIIVSLFILNYEVVEVIESVLAIISSKDIQSFHHDDSYMAEAAGWPFPSSVSVVPPSAATVIDLELVEVRFGVTRAASKEKNTVVIAKEDVRVSRRRLCSLIIENLAPLF